MSNFSFMFAHSLPVLCLRHSPAVIALPSESPQLTNTFVILISTGYLHSFFPSFFLGLAKVIQRGLSSRVTDPGHPSFRALGYENSQSLGTALIFVLYQRALWTELNNQYVLTSYCYTPQMYDISQFPERAVQRKSTNNLYLFGKLCKKQLFCFRYQCYEGTFHQKLYSNSE